MDAKVKWAKAKTNIRGRQINNSMMRAQLLLLYGGINGRNVFLIY